MGIPEPRSPKRGRQVEVCARHATQPASYSRARERAWCPRGEHRRRPRRRRGGTPGGRGEDADQREREAIQALPQAKRNGKPVRVCTLKKPKKAAAPDPAPIDYTKRPGLSKPNFTDVVRTTTELTVADGTRLHLEIVKPKAGRNLGVILEASPYHGTLYDRTGGRMLPLPGKDGKLVGAIVNP